MKHQSSMFATTGVALNGTELSVEALVSLVDSSWRIGLPMFVGHDMHRPIGWSSTSGLLVTPALVGVLGSVHVADSAEDLANVEKAARNFLNAKYVDVLPEDKKRLKEAIGIPLQDHSPIVRLDSVLVIEEGLAARRHPKLFSTDQDKDGLVNLAELEQIAPGVYKVDGLLLFAHRNFRRSMSHLNAINGEFLSRLGQCADRKDLQVKVALDPDCIGLPGTYRPRMELQHWWGPYFNEDLPSIANEVTRHEANSDLRFYGGIDRTEFWWHSQDDRKTLEAEEVLVRPSFGISSDEFAFRYVHSMLDPLTGKPNHLDGAVRIYDTDKYLARLDQDIRHAGRNTRYMKLWRIDGTLEVSLWKSLISDFYRDNRLVGEYFGGTDTVMVADDPDTPAQQDPLAEHLPLCIEPIDGVLTTISFEEIDRTVSTGEVCLDARQWFKTRDTEAPCIELSAVDFVKLLRTKQPTIEIPDDWVVIAFEDMDVNLPRVLHHGDAMEANGSLEALTEFTRLLAIRGGERFVTAELSVAFPDRRANFSFAGFVEPLHQLLKQLSPLPASLGELAGWCGQVHARAKAAWPAARYRKEHLALAGPGGSLIMRRSPAQVEPLPGRDAGHGVFIGKTGPLAEAFQEGRVTPVRQIEVRTAVCSTCATSCFACGCTALLTEGCTFSAQDCEMRGYVWAARAAL